MSILNLTGQSYGRCKVIARRGSNKHGKTLWLVRCKCKKQFIAVGGNLTSGGTTQCKECAAKSSFGKYQLEDLTGQLFGYWKVISRARKNRQGRSMWLVECTKCGNEGIVAHSALTCKASTKCRQCGDNNFREAAKRKAFSLIGLRFGNLVVIERTGSDENNNSLWKCLCDCGNHINVQGTRLMTDHTRSCGCLVRVTMQMLNVENRDKIRMALQMYYEDKRREQL